jgi:CheY-like chemotaxis protein
VAINPPDKKLDPTDKKIMVFDDDESIVQMIRATLEAEGFQVRTGRDGTDILKKAVSYDPDLIICDLMMPGGGGYEVLRALQGDDITRKIPVLMITGYSLDTSTKTMMQQEPNLVGYYEKPLRPEKLVTKVHQILNTMTLSEKMQQNRKIGFEDLGEEGGRF